MLFIALLVYCCCILSFFFSIFFFFKQKTAYEMRISDWSSDVCSSDLNAPTGRLAESLTLPQPYLLFLGDTVEAGYAKTAFGLADLAADRFVGEHWLGACSVSGWLSRLWPAPSSEDRSVG